MGTGIRDQRLVIYPRKQCSCMFPRPSVVCLGSLQGCSMDVERSGVNSEKTTPIQFDQDRCGVCEFVPV